MKLLFKRIDDSLNSYIEVYHNTEDKPRLGTIIRSNNQMPWCYRNIENDVVLFSKNRVGIQREVKFFYKYGKKI
jgi:hypothetical protein